MTASDARLHLRYSAWASQRILAAASALLPEDLDRDLKVSHVSILRTVAHIQFADWVWYARAVAPMERPADTLDVIQTAWPDLLQKWIVFADSLTDEDMGRVIEYKSLDGKPMRSVLWQIVMHVVNHATLHRGQVMAMLRQVGVKPPNTDLISYYRELEAK
jgi:uncharacterized damage-inducible protein DinB